MEPKDNIFAAKGEVTPFEFNETVASVFDDMISRSVPLYREIILQQARLAAKFYRPGTSIYDLGCSTGNFASALMQEIKGREFTLTAIDNSSPMIELFKKRITAFGGAGNITPIVSDIMDVDFAPASVIVSNLTVQFISPDKRDLLIKRIYDSLIPGGIFLLTEKTVNPDDDLAALQQEFYYRLKEENGYSQIEITRKREALENVLIPETVETHITRLTSAGFNAIEIWLKWFHFTSFICRKD
jgi:tRNA (cmo5U34)-methyltransferase